QGEPPVRGVAKPRRRRVEPVAHDRVRGRDVLPAVDVGEVDEQDSGPQRPHGRLVPRGVAGARRALGEVRLRCVELGARPSRALGGLRGPGAGREPGPDREQSGHGEEERETPHGLRGSSQAPPPRAPVCSYDLDMTRYLHTMYRITDPERSKAFYE